MGYHAVKHFAHFIVPLSKIPMLLLRQIATIKGHVEPNLCLPLFSVTIDQLRGV